MALTWSQWGLDLKGQLWVAFWLVQSFDVDLLAREGITFLIMISGKFLYSIFFRHATRRRNP